MTREPYRVYLAGPMRGIPFQNFPAFAGACQLLRAIPGVFVWSPHEHNLSKGFQPGPKGTDEELRAMGFDLRAAMRTDLDWICDYAHAVIVLPGWESSLGAKAEVATADAIGIEVWPLEQFIASRSAPGTKEVNIT